MKQYKRLTNQKWSENIDLTQELGYSYIYKRLYELEDKIEKGTLVPKYSIVDCGDTYCVCTVDTNNLLVIDKYETKAEAEKRLEEILWGMTGDSPNMEEVIPETVGQYTGIKDDQDVKIFEGDIVNVHYNDDTSYLTEVKADGNTLCVDVEGEDYDYTAFDFAVDLWRAEGCEFEVVDNIYDKNKDADASIEFLKAVDPLSVYHNF